MTGRRKYDESCAIAHGLDLIGERWALLVVRELLLGPKRFTDLRAGLPGAGPDMLTQRLNELQESGIVRHRKLPPPAAARVYELTEWGAELEPIVLQIGRWASRSSSMRPDGHVSADSVVLALKARFDAQAAQAAHAEQGLDATFALRFGEAGFGIHVAQGRLTLARGVPDPADATIATDPATLAAVLWTDRSLADAVGTNELTLDDPGDLVPLFITLFPRSPGS